MQIYAKRALGFVTILFALAACQPQLIQVEVTRLLEVTPAGTAVTVESPTRETVTELVEVTRLVNQEVTRVISSTVVEELLIEVTKSPLGSRMRPIQLLFPPTVNSSVIARRGQLLAEALAVETDLEYEIGIVDDEATLIQLMCAAPEDTVGFLSALAYVAAHQACGVQVGNVALNEHGFAWQTGMIVVRGDSGIVTAEDLVGKSWAVPEMGSIPSHLYFQALFDEAGIGVGEIIEVPGDSSAMLSVFNGDADFATATYVPPVLPFDDHPWEYGTDRAEPWRRLGLLPYRSPIGYILVNSEPEFGGYRLRDARSRIFDIAPSIYSETRIVSLSEPIPNDTIAFGSNFPLGMGREIIKALTSFAAADSCLSSLCSADFYAWAGLDEADEEAYDPLRFVAETLGSATDLFRSP